MTAALSPSQLTRVKELNATPLSRHVTSLLKAERVSPLEGLRLGTLQLWALENLPANQSWAETVAGLLAERELADPAELYATLAEAEPGILAATTLQEAGEALLALVVDLYPPRTLDPV